MPDLTKPAASSAEIDVAGAAATLFVMSFVSTWTRELSIWPAGVDFQRKPRDHSPIPCRSLRPVTRTPGMAGATALDGARAEPAMVSRCRGALQSWRGELRVGCAGEAERSLVGGLEDQHAAHGSRSRDRRPAFLAWRSDRPSSRGGRRSRRDAAGTVRTRNALAPAAGRRTGQSDRRSSSPYVERASGAAPVSPALDLARDLESRNGGAGTPLARSGTRAGGTRSVRG